MDTNSTPFVVTRRKLMMTSLIAAFLGVIFASLMIRYSGALQLQTTPPQGMVEWSIALLNFFWLIMLLPVVLVSIPISFAFPNSNIWSAFVPVLIGIEWAVVAVGVMWLTRRMSRRTRWLCYFLTIPAVLLLGYIFFKIDPMPS